MGDVPARDRLDELEDWLRWNLDVPGVHDSVKRRIAQGLALVEVARAAPRILFLAEHLFQMIDPQTWRDHGGDDGQGHYEGDYHAAGVREELDALRAALERLDGPDKEQPRPLFCPDCGLEAVWRSPGDEYGWYCGNRACQHMGEVA